MEVTCVRCKKGYQVSLPDLDRATATCPFCFFVTPFLPEDEILRVDAVSPLLDSDLFSFPLEMEVRNERGQSLGFYDIFEIQEKIYKGDFSRLEEVRDEEGTWVSLSSRKELLPVLKLVEGRDKLVSSGSGRRRFTGWEPVRKIEKEKKEEKAEARTGETERKTSLGKVSTATEKGLRGFLRRVFSR